MPEQHRLVRVLGDLSTAVAADAGAALYLDDGEGALQLVAATTTHAGERTAPWARLFRRGGDETHPTTLVLSVPDLNGGIVVLARAGREPFTTDDRAVARLYARQLAERITAEGYQPGSTVWTRQLEAIQRIAARLTRLASLEDVGLAICVETREVIDYDNARVYVLAADGVDMEAVAWHSGSPEYAGETAETLRVRLGEGVTGYAAARGEPLLIADAARDPRTLDVPGQADFDESMLIVPMRYEGRVTGVIVLSKVGISRFDEDDLRLLQVLSDQAAVAVENARLLAGRDQLVAELAALLSISQTASEAESEIGLASILARKLAQAARADACVISRWQEGTTLVRTLGAFSAGPVLPSYDMLEFPATRTVVMDGVPQVIQVDSPDADPAEVHELRLMGASTMLMLPLYGGGRIVGLVELFMLQQAREFSEYEMNLYRTMANQAGAVLENARLLEQLRQAADIDQLTGVHNHRYLQERLKQEVARSARNRLPLTILMIDLDGFKAVNDRHGHADGDRVLQSVAVSLKTAVRENDIVARYGGDEFVVLMPDTDEEQARTVARRIVAGVRSRNHQLGDGSHVRLSASAGLALYPQDGRTPATLLKAADAAMYAVKRTGGNDARRGGRSTRTTDERPVAETTSAGR